MSETALVRAVRAQQLEPVEYDDEHGYEKKNNNWRERFCVDQFEVILRDVRKTSRDVRDRDVHFTRPRRSN